MKRYEIFNLLDVINTVLPISKKVKLNMYLYSNKKILEKETEKIKHVLNYSEKFKTFEKERLDLCEKYCEKDKKGISIKEENVYKGLENNEEFNHKISELRNIYKEEIEEQQKQLDEFNELLNEDVDIAFDEFSVDLIPDDLINGNQLEKISVMVYI